MPWLVSTVDPTGNASRLVSTLKRRAPAGSTLARGMQAASERDPAARLLAMSRVTQSHERVSLLSEEFRSSNGDGERLIADVIRHFMGWSLSTCEANVSARSGDDGKAMKQSSKGRSPTKVPERR